MHYVEEDTKRLVSYNTKSAILSWIRNPEAAMTYNYNLGVGLGMGINELSCALDPKGNDWELSCSRGAVNGWGRKYESSANPM